MKIVKGNNLEELNKNELEALLQEYEKVVVDIGTGDGRFIFKSAAKNPQNFYIGVDPAQKQLEIYSKKANKNKITNCLFVLGSIEHFPTELKGVADSVYVILPWGTLLKALIAAEQAVLDLLNSLFRNSGFIQLIFGYSQDAEPGEVSRLGLEKLNLNYIYEKMVPAFIHSGFKVGCVADLKKEDLAEFESTWSKKLVFGQDRPLFELKLAKDIP